MRQPSQITGEIRQADANEDNIAILQFSRGTSDHQLTGNVFSHAVFNSASKCVKK
jgi:hypothetical protein